MSETPAPYTPDPQIVEENRIDRLRMALKRAGVDWPTIRRLDDIRANLAPEVQGPGDCSNCNEHVLLALVDRLTTENAALARELEAARECHVEQRARAEASENREARLADWTVQEGGWRIFHFADLPIPPDTFDLTDRINPELAPRLKALLDDDSEAKP